MSSYPPRDRQDQFGNWVQRCGVSPPFTCVPRFRAFIDFAYFRGQELVELDLTQVRTLPDREEILRVCSDQMDKAVIKLDAACLRDDNLVHALIVAKVGLIQVTSKKLTPHEWSRIGYFETCQALYVSRIKLPSEAIVSISNLKKLAHLNASLTNITDATLSALCALPLETLNCIQTELTDACVPTLSAFRRLKRLVISRTHITEAGLRSLQSALPDCTITH